MEPHSLLVVLQNTAATLGDSSVVSYKTKHILTIQSSNHTFWRLPKGIENFCPPETCTHMLIAALFIIAQIWKQPR